MHGSQSGVQCNSCEELVGKLMLSEESTLCLNDLCLADLPIAPGLPADPVDDLDSILALFNGPWTPVLAIARPCGSPQTCRLSADGQNIASSFGNRRLQFLGMSASV